MPLRPGGRQCFAAHKITSLPAHRCYPASQNSCATLSLGCKARLKMCIRDRVIALTARMIPGLHVLCGARTPQQVMDNAGALNIKLDGADAVRMKRCV